MNFLIFPVNFLLTLTNMTKIAAGFNNKCQLIINNLNRKLVRKQDRNLRIGAIIKYLTCPFYSTIEILPIPEIAARTFYL